MKPTRRKFIGSVIAASVAVILADTQAWANLNDKRDNNGVAPSVDNFAKAAAPADREAVGKGKREMKRILAGDLEIAYFETGAADGSPVILLHGFPYDAHSYDRATERLAAAGKRCITPFLRGYGQTKFRSADIFRSGQQAALGGDLLALMDALKIPRAVLAGYDWGGRAACVVAALHPERVQGLVSCGTAYNIQDISKATAPLSPDKEQIHWYWFYLNSERGRNALIDERDTLCHYLWKTFSPTWNFDAATFAQTAASFQNPDFVDVVLHSYRFRIGAVSGDPRLQGIEEKLSKQPKIHAPTIVLMGGSDGVDPPEDKSKFANHFTDLRDSQTLKNIGHNLPQEAPQDFADAVLRVGKFAK